MAASPHPIPAPGRPSLVGLSLALAALTAIGIGAVVWLAVPAQPRVSARDTGDTYTGPMPTPTPTASPVGIAVPASIDSTGVTDASAALYAWVRTVPDGSTIVFRAGGNYRMDSGLIVNGRHNLTFEGNGATLKSNGGYTEASSLFRVFGDTGIVIRDFNLVGNSPTPGIYRPGQEGAHGIQIVEGGNIEIANVHISNTYGDCVNTDYWTDGVWMHDSTCTGASRCGFAIFSGKNILIEHDTFDHNGGMVLDIEPYESDGGADTVRFINNTSTRQARGAGGPLDLGYFAGANGGGGGLRNITISGNTTEILTLQFVIPGTGLRYKNIVVTNNTATVAVDGPVMHFAHVDGLTITGNRVPLSSGQLADITDSTGVTYAPSMASSRRPGAPVPLALLTALALGLAALAGIAIGAVVWRHRRRHVRQQHLEDMQS